MRIKVVHVNYSGSKGGAAIAALRITKALNKCTEASSSLWCSRRPATQGCVCVLNKLAQKINGLKNILLSKLLKRSEYSINIFPSSLIKKINASDADIVHLHWVNGELISIKQLGKIRKPIVWTFHDMWAFCDGEHYTTSHRYIDGYSSRNLKENDSDAMCHAPRSLLSRVDIDRWTFRRKEKHWKNLNLHIVCPSRWLADCSSKSALMSDVPTTVIPNCVDLNVFKPLSEKLDLRKKWGLPVNKKILLFGAVDPSSPRKGGDLLLQALQTLAHKKQYAVAVFGKSSEENIAGIDTFWLGSIFAEKRMAEVYSCADVMCVPSRQDNLPNTCVEAHACGLPVVAFDIGGIPSIVVDRKTGYLAKPFDVEDFADGIQWVFASQADLSAAARQKAELNFDPQKVSERYVSVYKTMER